MSKYSRWRVESTDDGDHFISLLKDEISVVKDLPSEYSWSTREYYATAIRATRIKTDLFHASANWYLENVLPVTELKEKDYRTTSSITTVIAAGGLPDLLFALWALQKMLEYVKEKYRNPLVIIHENGYGESNFNPASPGNRTDDERSIL